MCEETLCLLVFGDSEDELYPQETHRQDLMMYRDRQIGLFPKKPLDGAKSHTALTLTKNLRKSISSKETHDPEMRE